MTSRFGVFSPLAPGALALGLFAFALAGCGAEDSDTDVQLPPDDSDDLLRDTGVSDLPDDSDFDSDLQMSPLHKLTLRQWGWLEPAPAGGPYETLIGELRAWEYLDGMRPPDPDTDTGDTEVPPVDTDVPADPDYVMACDLVYEVFGEPSDPPCPDCAWSFEVTFTLTSGNRGDCYDEDLPGDGDVWDLGYDPTSGWLVNEAGGLGRWLPWWRAEPIPNVERLPFSYQSTRGVSVEEEEEN